MCWSFLLARPFGYCIPYHSKNYNEVASEGLAETGFGFQMLCTRSLKSIHMDWCLPSLLYTSYLRSSFFFSIIICYVRYTCLYSVLMDLASVASDILTWHTTWPSRVVSGIPINHIRSQACHLEQAGHLENTERIAIWQKTTRTSLETMYASLMHRWWS